MNCAKWRRLSCCHSALCVVSLWDGVTVQCAWVLDLSSGRTAGFHVLWCVYLCESKEEKCEEREMKREEHLAAEKAAEHTHTDSAVR